MRFVPVCQSGGRWRVARESSNTIGAIGYNDDRRRPFEIEAKGIGIIEDDTGIRELSSRILTINHRFFSLFFSTFAAFRRGLFQ